VPEFSVFTAGYMLRDPAHQQKVFNGPIGKELFKTVSDKMDVTVLSTCYLGTRQVNLRETRAVKTPADLKGIKLRMPGSKDWLFLGNALGATATPLAFGEVYLGLKTGTIDGQDNPLPSVRAAKFYEVTKQIVLTSHLVDSLFIAISNKAFNALTAAQKQKVTAAPRPQRPSTTTTTCRKNPNWWSSSRRKACKSPHPMWRLSARRCRPPTRTRITPKCGRGSG
jgi:TRAP-type C4-dicarboxylate transport system substrate-binding protein